MSTVLNCELCTKLPSKYSCPRCNIHYCSVSCYQSQSHLKCSEDFYKECIVSEVAQNITAGTSDAEKKMYEILKRIQNTDANDYFTQNDSGTEYDDENESEEEIDSDDEATVTTDIAQRLKNIDLNNANAVWDRLTDDEKRGFENMIVNGDITSIIPEYQPWWEIKKEKKLIVDLDTVEGDADTNNVEEKIPKILDTIQPFDKISSRNPAPCVRHNLSNVLAAYCFTVRYYNGDQQCYPQEASNYFYTVCANLKSNANFDTEEFAIDSVIQECRTVGMEAEENSNQLMHTDLASIFGGPGDDKERKTYILAALSDIHNLLTLTKLEKVDCAQSNIGVFSKKYNDSVIDVKHLKKNKINACLRKIEYFLSYVKKFG